MQTAVVCISVCLAVCGLGKEKFGLYVDYMDYLPYCRVSVCRDCTVAFCKDLRKTEEMI
jgi:hypothetical protein